MSKVTNTFSKPVRYVRRKNQKTMRLRVKEDEIVVSAPKHVSKREMAEFLAENEAWVHQHLRKFEEKVDQRQSLVEEYENQLLVDGMWGEIKWHKSHPNRVRFIPQVDHTIIAKPDYVSKSEAKSMVYKMMAKNKLRPRFWEIQREIKYPVNKLYIRSQKTKWGTCSSKRNISLNKNLVKCPRWIQNYVIIHELCHLIHMNHSKKFWSLVESYLPEYRKAENWLDEHESMLSVI